MPASAPTPGGPGTTRDNEAVESAQRVLTVSLRGESFSFSPDNIPFGVRSRIRRGTGGLPFMAYWNGETSFDVDTLQVMWWTARMVNGDLGLTIEQVVSEWPTPLNLEDWDVKISGPGIDDDEPDAAVGAIDVAEVDDPESSGPSS